MGNLERVRRRWDSGWYTEGQRVQDSVGREACENVRAGDSGPRSGLPVRAVRRWMRQGGKAGEIGSGEPWSPG